MARVGLEELFVGSNALVEIRGRFLFTAVRAERRTVLALINHHSQFITDIEPDLGIVGEADRIDIMALQEFHVSLGKRARFAGFGRDGSPGRIDREAPQENRAAIEKELAVAAFKGTKAET